MNQTLKHIEFLATNHDCVIIPGLGAIIAHDEKSFYDETTSQWSVPGRSYMFNGALNINDGLLIDSVARANSISHEHARIIVNEDVTAMIRQLKTDNLLSLGRLGELMNYNDGKFVFTPVKQDTLTLGATWYPKACSHKIVSVQDCEAETICENYKIVPFSSFKRFVRVAVMIIILAGLGITLSTPIKVDDVAYASLSGPKISLPKAATLPKAVNINKATNQSSNAETNLNVVGKENICNIEVNKGSSAKTLQSSCEPSTTNKIKPAHIQLRNDDSDKYCLVIASMKTLKGAQKFISMEKPHNPNLPMYIIEQKGHYRVYVATGATKAQALNAAYDNRIQRYSGVWVTKR